MLVNQNGCINTSGLKKRSCRPQRSASIFSSFLILLSYFCFISLFVPPHYASQFAFYIGYTELSKLSKFLVAIDRIAIVVTWAYMCDFLFLCNSHALVLSDSMNNFPAFFSPPLSSLIPSTSFATLKTRILLMCTSYWCQNRICFFWLSRCAKRSHLVMVIVSYLACHFIGVIAFD